MSLFVDGNIILLKRCRCNVVDDMLTLLASLMFVGGICYVDGCVSMWMLDKGWIGGIMMMTWAAYVSYGG